MTQTVLERARAEAAEHSAKYQRESAERAERDKATLLATVSSTASTRLGVAAELLGEITLDEPHGSGSFELEGMHLVVTTRQRGQYHAELCLARECSRPGCRDRGEPVLEAFYHLRDLAALLDSPVGHPYDCEIERDEEGEPLRRKDETEELFNRTPTTSERLAALLLEMVQEAMAEVQNG